MNAAAGGVMCFVRSLEIKGVLDEQIAELLEEAALAEDAGDLSTSARYELAAYDLETAKTKIGRLLND